MMFSLPVLDLELLFGVAGEARIRLRERLLDNSGARVALRTDSSELMFMDWSYTVEVDSLPFPTVAKLWSRFGNILICFLRLKFGSASSSSLSASGTLARFLDFVYLGSDAALSAKYNLSLVKLKLRRK
jgi:hypothetical protein